MNTNRPQTEREAQRNTNTVIGVIVALLVIGALIYYFYPVQATAPTTVPAATTNRVIAPATTNTGAVPVTNNANPAETNTNTPVGTTTTNP